MSALSAGKSGSSSGHVTGRAARVCLGLALAGFAPWLALWWNDTVRIDSATGAVVAVGQLTGLAAGYALILLLLLIARIPLLDRWLGADVLSRWHSSVSRWTVIVALIHGISSALGAAMRADNLSIMGVLSVGWSSTYLLLASIAGLLFVVVGVTSVQASRRALPFEVWHAIHLVTYAAIGLGFIHQVLEGSQFVGRPAAQITWLAAYVIAMLLLLYYRLIVPIRVSRRHRLRVEAVVPEAPGYVSVYLAGDELGSLKAHSGQFFRWHFLVPGRRWASNPYSLSAAPSPHGLRITVKTDGDHSRQLLDLVPGTRVFVEGPYGNLTHHRRARPAAVLIAGGIGVAPLRAIMESVPASPGHLTLIYRAHSPGDVVLRGEIDQIAARRGFSVNYIVGDRHEVGDVFSPQNLAKNAPMIKQSEVYICGPVGLSQHVVGSVRKLGVPARHVHVESFTG